MRSFLVIIILTLIVAAGYFVVNMPQPDPLALKPVFMPSGAQFANPDGNVIWISLEGLRPDHLGILGYRNTTTPSIDSIAADSLLFERCYAQSTETYRSAATILTAEYPILYPGSQKEYVMMGFRDLLQDHDASLVTKIQDSGHTTCAIVSSGVLKSSLGFDQGFDYFDDSLSVDSYGQSKIRSSRETWEAADTWLSRNFRRPFFLVVHFPDPMGPYVPEERFLEQTRDNPRYHDHRVLPVSETNNRPVNKIPAYHKIEGEPPSVGEMIRLYDSEIAQVDYYIGKLLHSLEQIGIRDKTMIIISSMHGESLGEHGSYFNHGGTPYHNLVHVPLIINVPDSPSARIRDVTESINIMPTVLNYLGIDSHKKTSGMSLLGYAVRQSLDKEYPAFSFWDYPNVYTIINGNYKLISYDNKKFELFHVINDPEEIHDLYSPDDPVALDLKRQLDIWMSTNHQRGLNRQIHRTQERTEGRRPLSSRPQTTN